MADRARGAVWAFRGLFLALATGLVFLRLLPLGDSAPGWPGPDILTCLIFAWVLRRPDYVPVIMIAVVVLMTDFLFVRPPGPWTVFTILAAEYLRAWAERARTLSLPVEWMLAAGAIGFVIFGSRIVHFLTMLDVPGLVTDMQFFISTVLVYPLVVGVSHLVFGIRKMAPGDVEALGRKI